MSLLAMANVACVRGGRLLFEGLDLNLETGGAAMVSGPNGAGKSSLLRIAAGLLRPSAGQVRRATVGWFDEAPALDQRRPLGAALGFWAKLDGADPAPGIAAMGLVPLLEVPVHMLSTGQRRRAGLARVIASGAGLWLLDEPTNGLDQESVERFEQAVAARRARGGAVMAASHQPLELAGAQRIVLPG